MQGDAGSRNYPAPTFLFAANILSCERNLGSQAMLDFAQVAIQALLWGRIRMRVIVLISSCLLLWAPQA